MTDFPLHGFVYILTRIEKYLEECKTSISTLRQHIPDAHVTIITTEHTMADHATTLEQLADYVAVVNEEKSVVHQPNLGREQWRIGLRFKAQNLYDYTPYEQAIFLDTDTYILADIRHLFDLMQVYDVALTATSGDITPILSESVMKTDAHINAYNTGVIVFKKSAVTQSLFTLWGDIYETKHSAYHNDQAAFTEAVSITNCKVYNLLTRWNFRTHFHGRVIGDVEILHGRPHDWKTIERAVNVSDVPRLWFPFVHCCYWDTMPLSLFLQFILKLIFFYAKERLKGLVKAR